MQWARLGSRAPTLCGMRSIRIVPHRRLSIRRSPCQWRSPVARLALLRSGDGRCGTVTWPVILLKLLNPEDLIGFARPFPLHPGAMKLHLVADLDDGRVAFERISLRAADLNFRSGWPAGHAASERMVTMIDGKYYANCGDCGDADCRPDDGSVTAIANASRRKQRRLALRTRMRSRANEQSKRSDSRGNARLSSDVC